MYMRTRKLNTNNYCSIKTTPNACKKHLNIKRTQMPQINTLKDFRMYKKLLKDKLGLCSTIKRVNLDESIYASQKEINMKRARQIAKSILSQNKPKGVPVLMLKDKNDNYLVVDGHHRWLAYHFLSKRNKTNRRKTIKSHVTKVDEIKNAFKNINKTLKKSPYLFHKRHSF